MRNLLEKFKRDKKYKLEFETINSSFYKKYKAWARKDTKDKKKHQNNTIGRNISALKTFLKWATENGYNEFDSYDRLMAFIEKHLLDPFYLEGDVRVSLRSKYLERLFVISLFIENFQMPFLLK